jgi:hypothetical protein
MRTRPLSLIALIVSMLLAGCATAGPKFSEMSAATNRPPAPGNGRIYFYRTTVLGAALQPEVRLNGQVVGRAVPRGFFFVDAPAGNHEVSTSTEVERKLTLTLEPSQVRYVKFNVSMGFFVGHVYGELVEEAKGASEIADTHYVGPETAKP